MGEPNRLELHVLHDNVTILPGKSKSDAATAQQYGCNDGNDECGIGLLRLFRDGGDRRCFHVFLQIMTG